MGEYVYFIRKSAPNYFSKDCNCFGVVNNIPMQKIIGISLLSLLALTSCALGTNVVSSQEGSNQESLSRTRSSSTESLPSSLSSPNESSSSSLASQVHTAPSDFTLSSFFDYAYEPVITIHGSKEVFSFISDYQSDKNGKYVDAYLPVDIDIEVGDYRFSFQDAGLRMKGNTSRARFFEGGRFDRMTHFKISFKATFDDAMYDDSPLRPFKHDWTGKEAERKKRKDRNFLGLEKLDLKYVPRNKDGDDGCYLREVYAYESFRSQGLDASMATIGVTSLVCEQQSIMGAYEFVEPIDKEFLKRRYGKQEAQGDLYKCVYNGMGKADLTRSGAIDKTTFEHIPNGKIGVEDNYNHYVPCYQLKTNDKNMQESDFSSMCHFMEVLWRCLYDNGDKASLESVLDIEQFLKMSALSFLLGNFDDQRYDYNNFYLYFRPSDGKAIIFPYDWDWCLGLDAGHDMASKNPLDSWTLDGQTNSNLYLATLIDNGSVSYSLEGYQQKYLDYVDEMKNKTLDRSAYQNFASIFVMEESEETKGVLSYMEKKALHCA